MKKLEQKEIYVVYTNTDLTEGRGGEYAKYYCELKSTALRLCRGIGVQGSDGRIQLGFAYLIDNKWYYPDAIVRTPTDEDVKQEQIRIANEEKNKRQAAVLEKAKKLGLTDQDIKDLFA